MSSRSFRHPEARAALAATNAASHREVLASV
jgi:hypothetical protein